MKLLIDTHIFLWAEVRPRAIVAPLRAAISDPENTVYVSAASVWEIAVKRASGKLAFEKQIVGAVGSLGFAILPITGAHAEHAGALPYHHRDPFDRMIVAQAGVEGMILGTQDAQLRPYGVPTLGLEGA